MAMRPQDMTVTKSDLAAETIASAIWDAADQLGNGTAVGASVQRSLKRHARELLDLHDIKAEDVLVVPPGGSDTGGNFANGHGG
jgi:hypothetical protein